jgi:hypothetical protein
MLEYQLCSHKAKEIYGSKDLGVAYVLASLSEEAMIIRCMLVLVVCWFFKRWLCFIWSLVAAFGFFVKLLFMQSLPSSFRSGVFAGDRWESLRCRFSDLAAKTSSIWARWCILKTYSSILNLTGVYQTQLLVDRWLYGWSGCKRLLEKTIAGFLFEFSSNPLIGSICVLRHRQFCFQ